MQPKMVQSSAVIQPSTFQQKILDFVRQERGNALIQARAGSGKTSTLVMIAREIPTTASATFLAFNKSIATELSERLPKHVASSTFHSLTGRAVYKYACAVTKTRLNWKSWLDNYKTARLFDAAYPDEFAVRQPVLKLVSLLKAHGMMPDAPTSDILALCDHFDIESEDESISRQDLVDMARNILRANNLDLKTIDFDDMLYFVIVFNLPLDKFDFVMVDESQDTNEIQRAIVRRLCHPKTRVIAVGDEAQAIYGFRGASSNSMDLIRDEFDATTLPLSISYRCPSSVVRLAQNFVPDIEARENAPDGTLVYPTSVKVSEFTADDLIICRNTAPLVTVAYRLLASRVPCRIMGRDIGTALVALIKKLSGKRTTLAELPEKIGEYQERETQKALANHQESRAQSITDKCESILALTDSLTEDDRARGIPGLIAVIDGMFADKKGRMVTLATIHKSKGMESPRVIILDSHLMPSKYARQEWQQQQERNLQYVAVTRSLDYLAFVDSKSIGA